MAGAIPFVEAFLKYKKIVLFGKCYSPETHIVKELLRQNYHYELTEKWFCAVDIEKRQDCSNVEDYLLMLSGYNTRQVPLLFVKGRIVGGYEQILRLHNEDRLTRLFTKFSLESDSEEDDNDVRECRLRRHEIVVRVEELDDTEVVVRVADWVQLDAKPSVDYDFQKRSDSLTSQPSELSELKRASFLMSLETRFITQDQRKKTTSAVDVDPEWMYVGGKQQHKEVSTHKISSTAMVRSGRQSSHKTVTGVNSVASNASHTVVKSHAQDPKESS